ncbi:MAG: MoxR-like ATPase, partial [bacterium]
MLKTHITGNFKAVDQTNLQSAFATLQDALSRQVIGQPHFVEQLLIALLADGHLLVEGAPGLAKTRALKSLASFISADAQRIQFTPDLLPSDIIGTEIYRPEDSSFEFQPGPVFHQLVIADEINRAPAKVQSALLEAMAERQVSIGNRTLPLPELFMVMATQNPIEQEGTYPLPEAQLDRFLMQVLVDYPDANSENAILELARREVIDALKKPVTVEVQPLVSAAQILQARADVMNLHMSATVQEYLVQLVLATRNAQRYSETLNGVIEFGASPRATIALDRCSRARAWLQGRDFVTPEDVQDMAKNCLRHRLILSMTAEAKGIHCDQVIDTLLDLVP